jgi:hypothetical protein
MIGESVKYLTSIMLLFLITFLIFPAFNSQLIAENKRVDPGGPPGEIEAKEMWGSTTHKIGGFFKGGGDFIKKSFNRIAPSFQKISQKITSWWNYRVVPQTVKYYYIIKNYFISTVTIR